MSAILSADDLNDFISPGVACIKPVETLPFQKSVEKEYEVTTEDKVAGQVPPAQISLTDCLACSGCVTSAEAVLVSLQSHSEVLTALDSVPMLHLPHARTDATAQLHEVSGPDADYGKIFVASISPQVRASLAATYGTTDQEAMWMIEQLFCGTQGLSAGGKYGNNFAWVVDTNAMREVCLYLESNSISKCLSKETGARKPVLTSACPGWICYAEKTHPYVLPYLSKLKSPQALSGTLLKTLLSKRLGIEPSQIWHLAVMPCFDKKLEASRSELTDAHWRSQDDNAKLTPDSSRDVDCVITAREVLMLAEARGVSFASLPRKPVEKTDKAVFPDTEVGDFIFKQRHNQHPRKGEIETVGTSGGYLYHVLCDQQALYPGSTIVSERGRNADVINFKVVSADKVVFKAARYYGFRNIQNLVRKLKPARQSRLSRREVPRKPTIANEGILEQMYVEVMACPGGCTNGGGQIKIEDFSELQIMGRGVQTQKEWLNIVDEAYFSMSEDDDDNDDNDHAGVSRPSGAGLVNGVDYDRVKLFLTHWSRSVGVDIEPLTHTTFRAVESDVGKQQKGETERAVELASKVGGGW